MSLIAYTDGSCIPNPGKGGWAYIAFLDNNQFIHQGGSNESTNNIMELTAVIQLIRDFSYIKDFLIYSDSQYVINTATRKWKAKKNLSLWEEYYSLAKGKTIQFIWVKAHNGDKYNELVDNLAKEGIVNKKI